MKLYHQEKNYRNNLDEMQKGKDFAMRLIQRISRAVPRSGIRITGILREWDVIHR